MPGKARKEQEQQALDEEISRIDEVSSLDASQIEAKFQQQELLIQQMKQDMDANSVLLKSLMSTMNQGFTNLTQSLPRKEHDFMQLSLSLL